MRDVVVVGGGISGLTTAWHLKRAGIDVCLIEAKPNVGGCTTSEKRDGFILEKGPFNVMVRDPNFQALLEAMSSRVNVVTAGPAARARFIYRHNRLHKVPTSPISLATTRLLSFGGKCRMLGGMLVSRRPTGEDETIEQMAVRRLGREVADTMVSAVIAGIFAGDISQLSVGACFPAVGKFDAGARSLIIHGVRTAMRARKSKRGRPKRRWRGLVSIDGGLGALTSALGESLGEDLLCGRRVESVSWSMPGADNPGHYTITFGENGTDEKTDGRQGQAIRCRRLVMASPAAETGRLLRDLVPEAAGILNDIESASLVVLNLAYPRAQVGHPMHGFGFLVPHNEPDFPLMGVLWADSIFPHHAPPDHRLIRVFIGGARDPEAPTRSDEALLATAAEGVRDLLSITGEPTLVDICRYTEAIPQYHVGHREKIERVRAAVENQPRLYLVGNYLEGVSINDCVRVGTEMANMLASESSDMAHARGTGQPVDSRAVGAAG